jgi:hypothetical protein
MDWPYPETAYNRKRETSMQRRLAIAQWSRRTTEIAAQGLWSTVFTMLFTFVQVVIAGCIVLSVLVMETFRKDLFVFFGWSDQQTDTAIQPGWLLTAVALAAIAISLIWSISSLFPSEERGSE